MTTFCYTTTTKAAEWRRSIVIQ